MEFWHVGNRRYARFERLGREPGLRHAFATRPVDVSARTDDRAAVRDARRRQIAVDLGLAPQRLSWCVQVHEPRLEVVTANSPFGSRDDVDGLVTALPQTPLMTFSADCPLILAYDPRQRIVGMAHASWRCTVARMAQHLVERMRTACGCRPADLLAGIGPSAGPCCYEVKEDVYEAAANLGDRNRLFPRRDGRMYFDLWRANVAQLVAVGVPAANIESSGVCTLCANEIFYSFRREGPGCGHFGLLAGVIEDRD
jgi:YfiH family protein